jgi:hypothetical protein
MPHSCPTAMYICMCVCVCVCIRTSKSSPFPPPKKTLTLKTAISLFAELLENLFHSSRLILERQIYTFREVRIRGERQSQRNTTFHFSAIASNREMCKSYLWNRLKRNESGICHSENYRQDENWIAG